MNHAIRIYETGGPEVLKYETISVPEPAEGEVLIRQRAIGLNFVDTYQRSGLYAVPLPFTPGMEGAGVVEKAGAGVTHFKKGERVAYASGPLGAYAEWRTMPAARVVKIPDGVTEETAAAALVKGMTVEYLLNRTYKMQAGETILFHAAAGGVGLIACQWAKTLGARVIGTAGSPEKAALAKAHGCDEVILYKRENFVERVKELTGGKGVPVVYDSVGKDTFIDSLDCLQQRGMMVSFGNASGPVDPFPPGILSSKGSLFLTRPSLWHYTADDGEYAASANTVFDMIKSGRVKVTIYRSYKLAETMQAHADLEGRKTMGSVILKT
ncbi:MAG: quinone oxidoreductase family protein [Alphaproteobacteria bacterium]